MCKLLVQKLDCVVFNVDYRLCPENHYPQPLDDCFCATQWAWEHAGEFGADREMLAVGGDSAGGKSGGRGNPARPGRKNEYGEASDITLSGD